MSIEKKRRNNSNIYTMNQVSDLSVICYNSPLLSPRKQNNSFKSVRKMAIKNDCMTKTWNSLAKEIDHCRSNNIRDSSCNTRLCLKCSIKKISPDSMLKENKTSRIPSMV